MKNVLIIAGTGTMGVHVVNLLNQEGYSCWVTTRSKRQDRDRIHYLQGSTLERDFLKKTMSMFFWDAVIDFMYYQTPEFKSIMNILLSNTKQYVYISSARVYADTDTKITEDSPRLLDVCKDKDYIKTDEYALAKAREEDMLKASGKTNWTIVRPYITFGENTFQLSPIRKEFWLYRALKGKKIIFSKDLADKVTTFTYGYDVARGIVALVCNEKTYGEVFNITSPFSQKWQDILDIYLDTLQTHLGRRPKVHYLDSWIPLLTGTADQVNYDRLYNRSFDNSKLNRFIDTNTFSPVKTSIKKCLEYYLENNHDNFDIYSPKEAMMDRISGDWESLRFLSKRPIADIVRYIIYRLGIR